MPIEFDPAKPIWLQLVSEFSRRLVVGQWLPGERIPGVRDLATELGVNPNTIQRALAEMERDGLCRSERTSGRFVTDDPARIDQLRTDLATGFADEYVASVQGLRLDLAQATSLLRQRWGGDARLTNRPLDEGDNR